jgi:DNA-binding transcriptional ArsR family regulator
MHKENIIKIISNEIRLYIVAILGNKENPKGTISNLHQCINRELKSTYDYKAIHNQIKTLENLGVVKLKQEKKERGSPVYVSLTSKKYFNLMMEVLEFLKPKIIEELKEHSK